MLKWRNWIRGGKKEVFDIPVSQKRRQLYQDWLSPLTQRKEYLVCLFRIPISFVSFVPQNTLIMKTTNFPRVVEWACLVMTLPTQVSQQTSGDSICFLSDLRARWEPPCTWDLQAQTTNFPFVSLLFSSKRYKRKCPGILTLETLLKKPKKPNNTRIRACVSRYPSEAGGGSVAEWLGRRIWNP